MDSRRGSSSRPSSPQPGDWERCSVPHSKLVTLQTKGFLPPAFMVPVRAGLATYKGGKQAESIPSPSKGERVCLRSSELLTLFISLSPVPLLSMLLVTWISGSWIDGCMLMLGTVSILVFSIHAQSIQNYDTITFYFLTT